MTQEIEKAIVDASQIYPAVHQKPYLDGGIFGYKLAIDKACEWLEKKAILYVWENCEQGEHGIHKTMLEDFRKAMKGE